LPCITYLKRSSEDFLINALAPFRSSDSVNPFISTTGSASFPWPINKEAAEAISSALPTSVTSKVFPNKSRLPFKSDRTSAPLEPIAIPTIPFLQALPELSLIINPIF